MRKTPTAAEALFPPTRRGILELTYGEPARWWFLSEMAERLNTSPSSLQRELKTLTDTGILRMRRDGRRTYYQAESDASIFSELRMLIEKTTGVAERLREALQPVREKIALALIYGSVARGEERATSDVDLLVVADDLQLEDLYRRLAKVEERVGRKVNPTLYSPQEFRNRRESGNPFLEKIMKRRKLILLGSEDEVIEAAR
jgi:predicted nucleotidyltransferase